MHDDLRSVQRRWGRPGGVAVPRRARAALIAAAALTGAAIGAPASGAAPGAGPAGAAGPVGADAAVRDARHPSVSGDGRWVVFEAHVGERRSTFRADRATGRTLELTPVPGGARAGDSVRPVLSRDGCAVVVHTEMALDPFRDDDVGDRWDVYRAVVPECGGELGRWELVSTTADGSSRDDVVPDEPATLNTSGTTIAYTHPVTDRRGASRRSSSTTTSVSVVDLTVPLGTPGRTAEVPAMPVEAPTAAYRYRGVGEPALSGDGRFLVFTADVTASEPLPGWGTGPEPGGPATTQVYAWDRDDADRRSRIHLVSARDDAPAERGAGSPTVSVDGGVIAFESSDTTLVEAVYPACDEDCPTQVFRWERDLDDASAEPELTLVSATTGASGIPTAGDGPSWSPALDRGGDQVTFVSRATDLAPTRVPLGSGAGDGDVLVAELGTGELRRATDTADLGPVVADHARPSVSDTGRVVVFETADPSVFGPVAATEGRGIVSVTATPRLSLADLDFGTVLTGWDGDELYVSVLNEGPGAFAPAVVTSTTSAFRVVPGGSCTRGLIVPAGGSCTVHMAFNPNRPVPFSGVLTVEESAPRVAAVVVGDEPPRPDTPQPDTPRPDTPQPDTPQPDTPGPAVPDPVAAVAPAEIDAVSVAAVVTGAGGDPVLRVEPAGIDLGSAAVGEIGERRAFDIRNIGGVPTEVAAVQLGGKSPDEFVVTAESCTGRALNPGATCTVELEFRPAVASRRTASLTATTVTGEYTAGIVAGVGSFEPELHLAQETVRAGASLGLGLVGFPADTDVTLSFDDSLRSFVTLRTDGTGGLLAEVGVPRRTRSGERTLVATAPGGHVITATVVVERHDPPTVGLPGHGLG